MLMRKRWMTLCLALLLCLTSAFGVSAFAQESQDTTSHEVRSTTLAAGAPVSVAVPTFAVTLNHVAIDSTAEEYPFITYKDITYLPLTYYGCKLLGLDAKWTQETGLVITYGQAGAYVSTPLHSGSNSGRLSANIAQLRIVLNGTEIDNASEQYPFLVFRDVTYLPMTWKNMNTLLGCSYAFDAAAGLSISGAEGNAIRFAVAPHVTDDGVLTFTLDKATINNTRYVEDWCDMIHPENGDILSLGTSLAYARVNWDIGVCEDDFDGTWFSLPDGQNLSANWYRYDDDYVYYAALVYLDGKEARLLFRLDNECTIDSYTQACYGSDVNNAFDIPIGTVIVPFYTAKKAGSGDKVEYTGVEYTVGSGFQVFYDTLEVASYRYAICICDFDENTYHTDYAIFSVHEDGSVSFVR